MPAQQADQHRRHDDIERRIGGGNAPCGKQRESSNLHSICEDRDHPRQAVLRRLQCVPDITNSHASLLWLSSAYRANAREKSPLATRAATAMTVLAQLTANVVADGLL